MFAGRMNHTSKVLRGFGLATVVAASLALTAWLCAEAAETTGRPALPKTPTTAVASVDRPLVATYDPLVIAMDDWEETANGTVSEGGGGGGGGGQPGTTPPPTKKKKKKKKNQNENYWFNFNFYYFYFAPYTYPNYASYTYAYPGYFNYWYYYSLFTFY